jgi:hypothetical protein
VGAGGGVGRTGEALSPLGGVQNLSVTVCSTSLHEFGQVFNTALWFPCLY